MENKKSYYECKRCFFKCYQKNSMKKHLEKIKTCDRTFDSYKYKDDELYNLSLTRIYNINKNSVCEICNKEFKNIFTLKRHQSILHKSDNECVIEDNIKDNNIINESINNENNNIITNNNISINVISLDDKQKILLFLKKYKFTSILENILENEVNLNEIVKMNIKDIVNKTIIKLIDSLNNFKDDNYQKNDHNIDLSIIDNEMNKEDDVNDINKDNTYKICKLIGY